ncbi:uroporphyrinogen-III synthase [bacterium]|nr:uroporphyrinogen-III synthase [bacterium]
MKPLQGKRILITRDASQAGSLKDMLGKEGADVICIPTISIADPPDWDLFDQVANGPESYDWIVFSSVNAVKQTQSRLAYLQVEYLKENFPKIAVIGSQTALLVESVGWKVSLIPDRFQAEDLGDKLVAEGITGKRIWIPRALAARNVLIEKLESAGATVTVTPVYQNKVPYENRERLRKALADNNIDWVTFTSSSTVVNFFEILGQNSTEIPLPKLASIGSITTRTLESYSLKPEFTANPQNLEGLCQGLINSEPGD